MVLRSLLLALAVTGFLGYSFTFGLTDPDSFLKKTPDWLSITLVLICGLLYLVATWWAVKGFSEHKLTAIVSLGFCAFGLGFYALSFQMQAGNGKAAPGQYDYDFSDLTTAEKATVAQLAQDAGLRLTDAVFTEHWHIAADTANIVPSFEICVQKGHVTALNLSNHPVKNLGLLSKFPYLSDLYLRKCGLTDMSELQSTKLDRLDVSDNQLTSLKTLRGCPNVRWLFAQHNRLQSTEGIEQFGQLISQDLTGNPLR